MQALRLAVLFVTLAFPAHAARQADQAQARPGLDAYAGPGAWIDRYDFARLGHPETAVADLADHGVRTLYVETASWRVPRNVDIVAPNATTRLLDAAHALGLRVVAWYLPGLADRRLDMRRIRAALDFATPGGQSFDSFALDIEATIVNPLWKRNLSLLKLSRDIRREVGNGYALGAIVPDQLSTSHGRVLWADFPYRDVAKTYDVFLPMAYSSFGRARTARGVYAYSLANVRFVQRVTHRPVHLIGGITSEMSAGAQAAVARAARAGGAYGVSLYKYTHYDEATWDALRSWLPSSGAPAARA